ncbi:MAG: ShlB/FhaC/HecB family hemolysin secretion/activation protein [Burkholderiales bacterium]|nr:ShlB/FhaC/HecB family hemolysin secretion/activation protein [Burkholderiales bacterium]
MASSTRTALAWLCALTLASQGAVSWAQSPSAGNPLDQLPQPLDRTPAGGGVQVEVTPAPAPAATADALARQFVPRRFDIEGVKSVPFSDIAALFSPHVGKPVTVARLVELAREATALYQRDGWGLSFVYVPSQAFADGVVRVVAVEGHVADVRVEGDAGRSAARLQDIAARIRTEKPLRRETFERYSALLGRLPGLTVEASVPLPASTDGASVMTLKVTRKMFDANVASDLRRPHPRAVATATLNDTLTPGGQLSVSALVVGREDERLQAVQYRQAIGSEGLTLKAAFSAYRGDPDGTLGLASPFDRRTTNLRRELSALYPLRLGPTHSLLLSGGLYSVDNVETTADPATGNFVADDTRVRAAFAQLAWEDNQPRRARSASLLVARGLDGNGAGSFVRSNVPGAAGPGTARVDFTRALIELKESRRIGDAWGIVASAAAQVTPDTLPTTERLSFGGARFGRAYAPGETSGDQGWGLGFEVNRLFTRPAGGWVRQVQPYVLLEAARAYGELGTPVPSKLGSASLGLRLADLKHYMLDFSVSRAVGERPLENPDREPRLVVQFSFRL